MTNNTKLGYVKFLAGICASGYILIKAELRNNTSVILGNVEVP